MKPLLRRRATLVNGALGVLLLVGVTVAYFSLGDRSNAGATVRTTAVARGTVISSVSASGSVQSADSRDLSFAASGTVESIKVEAGDKVTKGQVLATLDDADARDNVTAAKAALDAADDDTSTPSGYSSYVSAKNNYEQALRQLDGTVLKAPFSGTILAVNGTVGGSSNGGSSNSGGSSSSSSSANSGSNGGNNGNGSQGTSGNGSSSSSSGSSTGSGFMTIAKTSKLQVKADFTEADTTKIKKGLSATVSFDALQGTTASGKVTQIDQTSTTSDNVVRYGVTVSLSSVPANVRIGATATVRVTTSTARNVLYVPAAAVRTAGGRATVTVMRNGRRVTTPVQVGVQGDQGTEIRSGLQEGDRVLLNTSASSGGGLPTGRIPGGGGLGGVRVGGRG